MRHTAFAYAGQTLPDIDVGGDVVADFAAAARDWPHRPAFVHNGAALTYREFAERVRRPALRYRTRAADEPAGLIGAVVGHPPAVAEHLLGILQPRAAYSPFDDALPVARMEALAAVLGLR